ncbi:hypothetical protein JTE90_005377 [Oedothorax gibbosus]|uniref:Uncharacterized protein n=1 Tax=Oedothorax gibbosus TaxID=931172 RepID=A0AAV6TEP9_9ARAC|nr:hypothetical protein JTE90_005377 [Oedothorax gibbosus]
MVGVADLDKVVYKEQRFRRELTWAFGLEAGGTPKKKEDWTEDQKTCAPEDQKTCARPKTTGPRVVSATSTPLVGRPGGLIYKIAGT